MRRDWGERRRKRRRRRRRKMTVQRRGVRPD
jgi:hypothetical protein